MELPQDPTNEVTTHEIGRRTYIVADVDPLDVDGARIGRETVALMRRRSAGEHIASRMIDVGFRLVARESA